MVSLFSAKRRFDENQFTNCLDTIFSILDQGNVQSGSNINNNFFRVIAKIAKFSTNQNILLERVFLNSFNRIVGNDTSSKCVIRLVKNYTEKFPISNDFQLSLIQKLSNLVVNFNGTILKDAAESLSNIIIINSQAIRIFVEENVLNRIIDKLHAGNLTRGAKKELAFTLISCFPLLDNIQNYCLMDHFLNVIRGFTRRNIF